MLATLIIQAKHKKVETKKQHTDNNSLMYCIFALYTVNLQVSTSFLKVYLNHTLLSHES